MRGLVVALLFCVACKDRSDELDLPDRRSAGTGPIVDDNYRFELSSPGPDWKLMREADAARIVPSAVAGAVHGNSVFGFVVVEATPGVTVEAYTNLLVDKLTVQDKQIEKREHIKLSGIDAVRVVVSGDLNGVRFRYVENVFMHQGYGYQVLGFGPEQQLSISGAELQPMVDHFKILPGKVSGRASTPVVTEAQGPGWRVKDGVFESAVTGLRARAKEPWRLLVGSTLDRSNHDAEIGIEHVDPEVYVVLIAERAPAPALRERFIAEMRKGLGTVRGKPAQLKFTGKDLAFERITAAGTEGMAFEYLHGVHIEGDILIQVLAWYLVGDRERAEHVVQSGLDAFDFMSTPDRLALVSQLERAHDTQSAVGPGYALRNGTYRSFAGGWKWTKPKSIWRIGVGDRAHTYNAASELMMNEPSRNLYGLVISEQSRETAKRYHEIVLGAMPGKKGKPSAITIGSQPGFVSTLDSEVNGAPTRYRVATLKRDTRAVQLVFWGAVGDMTTHADMVDLAIHGFQFDPTPETETYAGEYHDHRFGFAVRPPAGAQLTDETPREMIAMETFVMWKRMPSIVGIVAVNATTMDEAWFLDFLENLVRDSIRPLASGGPTRSAATLGGQPARRLSWAGLDGYVMIRDGTIYAFLTSEGNADAFRLLDR